MTQLWFQYAYRNGGSFMVRLNKVSSGRYRFRKYMVSRVTFGCLNASCCFVRRLNAFEMIRLKNPSPLRDIRSRNIHAA